MTREAPDPGPQWPIHRRPTCGFNRSVGPAALTPGASRGTITLETRGEHGLRAHTSDIVRDSFCAWWPPPPRDVARRTNVAPEAVEPRLRLACPSVGRVNLLSCPVDLAPLAPDPGDQQGTQIKEIVPCVSAVPAPRNPRRKALADPVIQSAPHVPIKPCKVRATFQGIGGQRSHP